MALLGRATERGGRNRLAGHGCKKPQPLKLVDTRNLTSPQVWYRISNSGADLLRGGQGLRVNGLCHFIMLRTDTGSKRTAGLH